MLKPTQDKELRKEINAIQQIHDGLCACSYCQRIQERTTKIINLLDKRGYHIGLPSNIEWALNSGDGVYRP